MAAFDSSAREFFAGAQKGASLDDLDPKRIPAHVAVIMDGNGRWAKARGQMRTSGHKAGVEAVREAILACDELDIRWLTIYAFSTENWKRPRPEVDMLMSLFASTMAQELKGLEEHNARIRLIGEVSSLPPKTRSVFEDSVARTRGNTGLTLTMAVNYGGRREIANACKLIARDVFEGRLAVDDIDEAAISARLYDPEAPDPELVIRTSGEKRLSNFLIWQAAYSEFVWTDTLWPDFDRFELLKALIEYQVRNRRFGAVEASE